MELKLVAHVGGGLKLSLTLPGTWRTKRTVAKLAAYLLKQRALRRPDLPAGGAWEVRDNAGVALDPAALVGDLAEVWLVDGTPPAPPPAPPTATRPAVFVVLLRRDAQRVQHVERRLLPHLPNAHVMDAVDGATDALAEFMEHRRMRVSADWARLGGRLGPLKAGQLACTCSHVAVWEEVARRGLEAAVVLEDDATLVDPAAFPRGLERVLAELADLGDWDWCYLFHHPYMHKDLPLARRRADGAPFAALQRAFPTWGTVAYVVSAAGAAKLRGAASAPGRVYFLSKPLTPCFSPPFPPELYVGAPLREAADEMLMKFIEHGTVTAYSTPTLLVGTAGKLNPLDTSPERFRSNVEETRAFVGDARLRELIAVGGGS